MTTAIENETRADDANTGRRVLPRFLREHLFLSVAVVCLLLGSGFRFAAGTAAGTTPGGSAATACAAK